MYHVLDRSCLESKTEEKKSSRTFLTRLSYKVTRRNIWDASAIPSEINCWSRLHLQSLAPSFKDGWRQAGGRITIAESLLQHDEKHVVPTPLTPTPTFYQNYLAMRNTADMTGGNSIAAWSSFPGVSAINLLSLNSAFKLIQPKSEKWLKCQNRNIRMPLS
jgi:hypothetical protein